MRRRKKERRAGQGSRWVGDATACVEKKGAREGEGGSGHENEGNKAVKKV